jgi:hypothetical protein
VYVAFIESQPVARYQNLGSPSVLPDGRKTPQSKTLQIVTAVGFKPRIHYMEQRGLDRNREAHFPIF